MDEALGRDGLAVARAVGSWAIERFGQGARRRWGATAELPTALPWGQHPSLMNGLAGIGHFYLRLADPRRGPPVLVPGASMDAPGPRA